MNARATHSARLLATIAAAALALALAPFAGVANAAVAANEDGSTGIRPGWFYNPGAPNGGSQRVPVFVANGEQASVDTFQVTTPNRWKTGDQLRVVLSAGVVFGTLYSVDTRGPTSQASILADQRPQIGPQSGVRLPTYTYRLDPTNPGAAVLTFTNDSAPVADPDVRFVTIIGASVIVSPGTKQGALTATVFGVDAGGSGSAVPLNAVTTLAYVTNLDVKVSYRPLIAGAGPQPMAPIRLTETAPGALVDGTYALSFNAGPFSIGSGPATTPVPVSPPDPAGSRFDVQVGGDATLTPGSAAAQSNTLTLPVGSLSSTGALESLDISGVRLDPPPGTERITVTLTKISNTQDPSAPSPSTTQLTFVPVNTPNAGNARAAGPDDLLTPRSANASRVPAEVGLTPQASIGLLAQNGRIGGNDRYQTAAQVAQQLGAAGKDINGFVVASGEPGRTVSTRCRRTTSPAPWRGSRVVRCRCCSPSVVRCRR